MFKRRYRAILVMSLIIICGVLYIQAKKYIDKTSASTPAIYDTAFELLSTPTDSDVRMVVPCGDPIGIYVKAEGVMVISVGSVNDVSGQKISPCEGVLKSGDYITEIDGKAVGDKKELIDIVKASEGKRMTITVKRQGEQREVSATPACTEHGYMLGVWVKDDISGIGTLTYVDENGFVALGHSINDNDTGLLFSVSDGAIFKTRLVNIVKPTDSSPGKIEGMIDYTSGNILGRVEKNNCSGISGYLTADGARQMRDEEWMPVAGDEEIHLGTAYLVSGISGERVYYQIEIEDIDIADDNSKNMKIRVVDEKLIALSGGIVQGMSGTPIVQDGKLIGAVTHVFVNDPTRGYGICISRMLKQQ